MLGSMEMRTGLTLHTVIAGNCRLENPREMVFFTGHAKNVWRTQMYSSEHVVQHVPSEERLVDTKVQF